MPKKKKQTRITDFFATDCDSDIPLQVVTQGDLSIEFFQINHQKRILSNEEITSLAQRTKAFCILGQEPSTFGFNVTGINSGHTLIQAATDRPRAYISCHKELNAWPVENLCSRDVATAIIDTHEAESGKLLICSIYWDGRIENFPEEASSAARLAREKDYTLILGGDLNARNTLYGSDITDKRGRVIEDLLVNYDLQSANKGTRPTCVASDKGSIIDATFINGEKAHLIQNWRVSRDETFSDHKLIRFHVQASKIESKKRWKMNIQQKESFT